MKAENPRVQQHQPLLHNVLEAEVNFY